MSSDRMLFQSIEATPKHSIKLGNGKALQVEGIEKISLRSNNGKITTLNDVQFVQHLPHNLLSVGQLMTSRYAVEFTQGKCIMKEENSQTIVTQVPMTTHRLFPLDGDDVHYANIAQDASVISELWHKRFGHLNMKSLKKLTDHQMVSGLPPIIETSRCEACSLGK